MRTLFQGLVAGAMLAALGAMPAMAATGQGIATAVASVPEATGVFDGTSKTIIAQDQLFEGQQITTGANGQVEILFADNTHMVVGPSSTLVIESILMQNSGTASTFAVNALGGTFRFITGNSKKTAYKITTPTATIGVRGTKFDFNIDKKTKETYLVLFEGLAIMCPINGACKNIEGNCKVGQSDTSQAQTFGTNDGKFSGLTTQFPYIESQQGLQTEFRVREARGCSPQVAELQNKKPPEKPVDAPPPPPPPPGPPPPPPPPPPPGPPPPTCQDDCDDDEDGGKPRGDHNEDGHPDNGENGEHKGDNGQHKGDDPSHPNSGQWPHDGQKPGKGPKTDD